MAMRLKRLIDLFLEWCEQAREPATTRNYRYLLLKFAGRVGNVPIDRLKPVHLATHGKSWHEVQSVQRLFQWAKDDLEVIGRNPFAKVKRPPAGQRTRILSPRELAGYLRRARPAFRRFLTAMRETLARPQEIRLLRWEYLHADDPRHSIEEALAIGKAKFVLREYKGRKRRLDPSQPRVLLVNRRLGRMLLRLRAREESPHGAVFRNSAGQPWTGNAVRCCMRRLRRRFVKPGEPAGEKVVAYTLRHTMGTMFTAAHVRDRVLADLMGHASTRTTARYQHLQVEHLWEAFDQFQAKNKRTRRSDNRNRTGTAA